MNQTQLRAVALGTTIALTGGLYLFMSWQRSQREAKERREAQDARLFDFEPSAVLALELSTPDGAFVLERDGETWTVVEPRRLPADRETVPSMVRFLSELRRIASVEERRGSEVAPPAALTLFELDPPRYTVSLVTVNGKKTLEVGKKNDFDGNVYASVAGEDAVFTVDGGVHFHLDKDLRDLRDKRVVPVEPAAIRAFEGRGRRDDGTPWRLRAVRKGAGFVTEPETGASEPLEATAVDTLLRRITGAQVLLLSTQRSDDAAIGELAPELAEPDAEWTIEGEGTRVTLRLRELEDPKRYLVSSSALGVGELSSPALHRRLIPEPNDLVDRRLFPWPRDAYRALTLRRGDGAVRLLEGEDGWSVVGEGTAAQQRIRALLYNLSRLRRGPQAPPEGLDFAEALTIEAESGEKRKSYELLVRPEGPSWGREGPDDVFAFDGGDLGTLSARPSDYVDSP